MNKERLPKKFPDNVVSLDVYRHNKLSLVLSEGRFNLLALVYSLFERRPFSLDELETTRDIDEWLIKIDPICFRWLREEGLIDDIDLNIFQVSIEALQFLGTEMVSKENLKP